MRTLLNHFDGHIFYQSSFNPHTGLIVRATETNQLPKAFNKLNNYTKKWESSFPHRNRAFSPVPETVDVAINNWCNYGCSYCYMDSTTKGVHIEPDFVKTLITGFKEPPYQIAYGGGSPTQHPQFTDILRLTADLGVIPNYTTEGQNLTDAVLDTSQDVCGGIALTYHAHRGTKTFVDAYKRIRERFHKQLNVHLIVDQDAVANLETLIQVSQQLEPLNLVLLAYYPDVGRSLADRLPKVADYTHNFPKMVAKALENKLKIAFSEGLIPYFLSHDTGVDTSMVIPTEGHFSAYVDVNGRMSHSSFSPPKEKIWNRQKEEPVAAPTIWDYGSQRLWNEIDMSYRMPSGANCDDCANFLKCSVPNIHHYFICDYANHNSPNKQPKKERTWY